MELLRGDSAKMLRIHAFTGAASTSIAGDQPHRKTQIPSIKLKHHQPNICAAAAPPLLHLHSQLIKPKSLTEPLNESVRATLRRNLETTNTATHCRTSGSDHDIDTESFGDMIYGYWSIGQHRLQREWSPSDVNSDCDVNIVAPFVKKQLCQMLEGILSRTGIAFESRLLEDAAKALATAKGKTRFTAPESAEKKSNWRRFVMNTLRTAGYNAAICNSRWEQTTRYPSGDYEFIDVVMENERFLVDINFEEQFEIARPTNEYNALLQQLPILFVGREDKLIGIIKIMCDASRRSLKERGMYMLPWRKYGYMQAKWVGCYKRTTTSALRAPQGSSLQFPFSGITLKGMDDLLTREQRDRYENKVSGLAVALAEAGLTPSLPSIGT